MARFSTRRRRPTTTRRRSFWVPSFYRVFTEFLRFLLPSKQPILATFSFLFFNAETKRRNDTKKERERENGREVKLKTRNRWSSPPSWFFFVVVAAFPPLPSVHHGLPPLPPIRVGRPCPEARAGSLPTFSSSSSSSSFSSSSSSLFLDSLFSSVTEFSASTWPLPKSMRRFFVCYFGSAFCCVVTEFSSSLTGFRPKRTGRNGFLPSFTEFYRVSQGLRWFSRVVQGFTEFEKVLPSFCYI